MRDYEQILRVSALVAGCSVVDVVARCRRKDVVNARSISVVLLRRRGWTIEAISAACGGLPPSSVVYHHQRGTTSQRLAPKLAAAAVLLESLHV
jgi:hypothetical protein